LKIFSKSLDLILLSSSTWM